MPFQLLVVDDDEVVTSTIEKMLPENWEMTSYNDPNQVSFTKKYHAAFIDMHLSGDLNIHDGAELVKQVKHHQPNLEVLAISGDMNQNTMELALEMGACRYIAKPLSQKYIQAILNQIESYFLIISTSQRPNLADSKQWVGQGTKFLALTKKIAQLKHEPGPILIEGETGTGKEVVAQLLRTSESTPFIAVNVAEVAENLFESEFFGHSKGAFTGAAQNKMGLIEAADGGDLFIDEIEALNLNAQVKLLRFLQEGEIRRVGASESKKVNVRVLIATNKNLEQMIKNGTFRDDLFWRINGKKIELTPLKSRPEDIEPLVRHFLKDITPFKTLAPEALEELKKHTWPGNVRELKRACEKIVHLSPLPIIRKEDIDSYLILSQPVDFDVQSELPLQEQIDRVEKSIIERSLQKHKNIDIVCEKLSVSRSNLYKKIKEYDIQWRNS